MGKRTQTLDRGRLGKSVIDRQIYSKFEVFGSQRTTFVRHRKNEKMLEECLTPSVKHRGGNVKVWGCFGSGKVGDVYHSILQRHAIPCGRRLIGANFPLKQGNGTAPNYERTI